MIGIMQINNVKLPKTVVLEIGAGLNSHLHRRSSREMYLQKSQIFVSTVLI